MSATPTQKRTHEQDEQRSVRAKPPPGARHFIIAGGAEPDLKERCEQADHLKELYMQATESLNTELEEVKAKSRAEQAKADYKNQSLVCRIELRDRDISDLKTDKQDLQARIDRIEDELHNREQKYAQLHQDHFTLLGKYEELGDTNEGLRKDIDFLERRLAGCYSSLADKDTTIKTLRADAQVISAALLKERTQTLDNVSKDVTCPISMEISTNLVLLRSGHPLSLLCIVELWKRMDHFKGDPYTPLLCPYTRDPSKPSREQVGHAVINRIARSLSTDPLVDTRGGVYLVYKDPGSTIWQDYLVLDQLEILSKLVFAYKQLLSDKSSNLHVTVKGTHNITIDGSCYDNSITVTLSVFCKTTRTVTPHSINICEGANAGYFSNCQIICS